MYILFIITIVDILSVNVLWNQLYNMLGHSFLITTWLLLTATPFSELPGGYICSAVWLDSNSPRKKQSSNLTNAYSCWKICPCWLFTCDLFFICYRDSPAHSQGL